MSGFALDLRAAARGLWKARGFSAVVVATLALGTGATAAMFSVLRASLLRPPPFPDADRLVILSRSQPGAPAPRGGWSIPEYQVLRDHAGSFEGLAAYWNPSFTLAGYGQTERVEGEVATERYFQTLGVAAQIGRNFVAGEDSVPGAAPVVVLSQALWRRRFGADPEIVGKSVSVNRAPLIVIGVMPEGFRGLSGRAELWIPQSMVAISYPGQLSPAERFYTIVVRLRRGGTITAAQPELQVLGRRVAQAFPDASAGAGAWNVAMTPLAQARLDPTNRGPLLILFGAVGVLLLIACANTANLLLVRGASRAREIAVRLAVGSNRRRLVSLLLSESVLLSLLGGAVGLLLAWWAVAAVTPLLPSRAPNATPFRSVGEFALPRLDLAVLGFAWAVSLLTAVLFGLAPALRAAHTDPGEALKAGGRAFTPSGRRVLGLDGYGALAIAELALAIVLLAGSGLLLRSLYRLESLPLGFDTEQVLTARIQAPLSWYRSEEAPGVVERVVEGASRLPEVEVAAATFYTPFDPGARHGMRVPAGTASGPPQAVWHQYVTPEYFSALRIPLLAGRSFSAADRLGRPPVAVISAAAARKFWPGENPLGKRFLFDRSPVLPADSAVEVIGVVGDVRYRSAEQPAEPNVYTPYYQFASFVYALVIVRSRTPSARLVPALRQVVAGVDRELPVADVQTMEERGGGMLVRRRLNAFLLTVFAGLALVIATVGVYGVISYQGVQRAREFGIRVALGATATEVLGLVLRRAVALVGVGLGLGVLGALALTPLLRSQLVDVGPADPVTLAVVAAVLAAAALVASYLPARRATRVEPLSVLRSE
jgi:putative ABC transport system permease protein